MVYSNPNFQKIKINKVKMDIVKNTSICPMTGFIYSELIDFYLSKDLSDSDLFYQIALIVRENNPDISFDWEDYFLLIEILTINIKNESELEKTGYLNLMGLRLDPSVWQKKVFHFDHYLCCGLYSFLDSLDLFQVVMLKLIVQAKMEFFFNSNLDNDEPIVSIPEKDSECDDQYNLELFKTDVSTLELEEELKLHD